MEQQKEQFLQPKPMIQLEHKYKPSDYYEDSKYSNGSKVSIVGQKLSPLIADLFVDTYVAWNLQATAWLTDTEWWDKYTDKNGKALYAIASPTAELFRSSFNATASSNGARTITLIRGTNGYSVDYEMNQLKSSYNKGIYNKDGSSNWWIASPAGSSQEYLLRVCGVGGYFNMDSVSYSFFVFRPVVCLPASEVPVSVLSDEQQRSENGMN